MDCADLVAMLHIVYRMTAELVFRVTGGWRKHVEDHFPQHIYSTEPEKREMEFSKYAGHETDKFTRFEAQKYHAF